MTKHMGRWSEKGLPHRGWICTEVEDLGPGNTQTCEMCQTAEPRYIHHMRHPEYSETLAVGCVCAGNLERDKAAAREREDSFKRRQKRRERFPHRKQWRTSQKGNPRIDLEGYRVVIVGRSGSYRVTIKTPDDDWVRGRQTFETLDAAKRAGFDGVMWLKDRVVE